VSYFRQNATAVRDEDVLQQASPTNAHAFGRDEAGDLKPVQAKPRSRENLNLCLGPHFLRFEFDHSEIIDRDPRNVRLN
jgi:hypothetical protein